MYYTGTRSVVPRNRNAQNALSTQARRRLMTTKSSSSSHFADRRHMLATELRTQSPQWADRLEQARTEHELRALVCDLFNLSHSILSPGSGLPPSPTLPARIKTFISDNLHRGMSLKVLAQFLGYSDKYCSDLFSKMMGEPFSAYLRRYRVEQGSALLRTSGRTLPEIAASLGFSDQFAFSHFFKRATGHSPMELRMLHVGRRPRRSIRTFRLSSSDESAYPGRP